MTGNRVGMDSLPSISEASQMIAAGKISPSELVESCFQQMKRESELGPIYLSSFEDLAKKRAKELDEELKKDKGKAVENPLFGIPFSLKDLFVTKGLRTTAGSKMLLSYIPPYEGYVSGQLQEKAKSILVGKVSLDEFGMGQSNESGAFGAIKNPLNPKKVAGGSSGGSAAAVASGMCLYSIGTDTGGSARLPANFCGIAGFKPSYGRVSRFGQIAYASSLDQASPLAKNVKDLGLIMEWISEKTTDPCSYGSKDSTHLNWDKISFQRGEDFENTDLVKKKRLGFAPQLIERCDESIKKALYQALHEAKNLGVELVECEFPHLDYAVATYYIIACCEASSNLARYDGILYGYRHRDEEINDVGELMKLSRTEGFCDEVKKRIILGTFALSSGHYDAYYSKALQVRELIRNDFTKIFSQCDFYFSPVAASGAFDLGKGDEQDPIAMYNTDVFTVVSNLAWIPAVAFPFGRDQNNLPTGPQVMAPHGKDRELLLFAHGLERGLSK